MNVHKHIVLTSSSVCITLSVVKGWGWVGVEGEMKAIGVRVSFELGTDTNGWSNFLTKSTSMHKMASIGSLVNESAQFCVQSIH